jgi:hypothetical protein
MNSKTDSFDKDLENEEGFLEARSMQKEPAGKNKAKVKVNVSDSEKKEIRHSVHPLQTGLRREKEGHLKPTVPSQKKAKGRIDLRLKLRLPETNQSPTLRKGR